MSSAPSGRGGPFSETQRRIRRNRWLFTAPLVLLCVLAVVLIWEIVRGNIPEAARTHWPWRLQLMSAEPLASLLAVAAGAVLARAQYSRAIRPVLGWRSEFEPGLLPGSGKAWKVGILNGGQNNAVLEQVDYHLVMAGDPVDGPDSGVEWTGLTTLGEQLADAGLRAAVDFRILYFGGGYPMVATGSHETIPVGVFSKRFIDEVHAFYMRIRVTDGVGDTHERIIDCLKGARESVVAPVEEEPPVTEASPGLPAARTEPRSGPPPA
ncbi:hypothetical protein OG765_27760 [Streptomyces sp. NBC_00555]|uniref:hypothetical protein n=1 Tax=Streptomyces sp. NBC_00555 TaxID=2903662 RepID=UPI0022524178|nr:hypothetical protein [Streptomyces sp. NBC_00555]MCX5014757.1 hypothetical protein [Streptomyces sp. NBC_00555]